VRKATGQIPMKTSFIGDADSHDRHAIEEPNGYPMSSQAATSPGPLARRSSLALSYSALPACG
jgi:hypothetical protein